MQMASTGLNMFTRDAAWLTVPQHSFHQKRDANIVDIVVAPDTFATRVRQFCYPVAGGSTPGVGLSWWSGWRGI